MNSTRDIRKVTASEIMIREVVTAAVDMPLDRLAQLFSENKITGAPVIDFDLNVVGVVSETDLVRHQAAAPEKPHDEWYFFRSMEADDKAVVADRFHVESLGESIVGDIMTRGLVVSHEAATVPELARQMTDRGVHRLLIVKGHKLRGIVTTMDILRAVAS